MRVLTRRSGASLLVAVAADGAGTSERASEGARLACDAIQEQAGLWANGSSPRARGIRPAGPRRRAARRDLAGFAREDVLRFVAAAQTRIVEASRRERLDPRAFSCTLLVALVDEGTAVFFQIGDGAIVYQAEDGSYVPALWPQSGEYANCTWFLTDAGCGEPRAARRARAASTSSRC